MKHIPVSGPWITQKEIEYVTDAVTNAWYGRANMYHERFEKAFAEHLGMRFAVSLPSCTSAIHLSLLALGVGAGDEVIVPDVTWIASAAPITYVGARTVFADVDPQTWCISADSFAACITPRTKAVIPVDLYGNIPDMDALKEVACRHGIAVVEDAAEAVGATYKGRPAGSLGEVGVFSFHGSKTLTTGEGGMLVTNDEGLFSRVNFLRDHGRVPGDFSFENSEVAYKYKMSSMQAALGLAQIERIDELLAKKRQIFHWYHERLGGIAGIALNDPGAEVEASYWMVSLVWDDSFRLIKQDLRAGLAVHGIDTRPFFSPLSSLGAYKALPEIGEYRQRNPVSYCLHQRGINLPSALSLEEKTVDFVASKVIGLLEDARTSV